MRKRPGRFLRNKEEGKRNKVHLYNKNGHLKFVKSDTIKTEVTLNEHVQ